VVKNLYSLKSIKLLLFSLALIISCTGNNAINPIREITVENFPNDVGDFWKYFYYDSLSSYSDIVTVRIIGDTIFNENRTAKIWEYVYTNKTEYRYAETVNDTVRIFNNLQSLWTSTKFIFPLKAGNGWRGDFLSDTSFVERKEPILVSAGYFAECYLINESWGALNDYGRVLTWLVPGIGIVKKHHRGWSFGMANNYWELLEYKIKF
jgi:hypothetical protein